MSSLSVKNRDVKEAGECTEKAFYNLILSSDGSCEFRDPDETLKRGYCSGGNCYFEGTAFPDFNSFLSY